MIRPAPMMAASVALASACWRSSPPPPAPPADPVAAAAPAPRRASAPRPIDRALQQMQQFADDMCACNDAACVQRVSDEMARWAREQGARDDPPDFNEEDTRRATEIGERMGTCMQQALSNAAAGSASSGSATP